MFKLRCFALFIASKPSILIVDDDTSILRVFSRIFQRKGYCVTIAGKGKEAMEKICANQYDVALVDLVLPDMEGDTLFALIAHASPGTLKVMITGKTDLQDRVEGADVFVGKPVSPEKLLSIIDTELKYRDTET